MQGVMTVTVIALINGETRSGACDDTETTSSTPECRDLNKTLKDVRDYYRTTGHWSGWPWYTVSAHGQTETSSI